MNTKTLGIAAVVLVVVSGVWWGFSHEAVAPTPSPSSSISPSPTPTPTPPSQPNITITSPKANALVDVPIIVTGKARVFENQFTVQVKDDKGNIIAIQHVFTDAKDSGQFGNYTAKLYIPAGVSQNLTIESLAYSAKGDGSFEGYAKVPVKIKDISERSLYVALLTSSDDCSAVKLFPRTVFKTQSTIFAAVSDLLYGIATEETAMGAHTVIPTGVQINGISQHGDTVNIDFNEMLQQGAAGSCKVLGIRAQITATIKQFLGVNNVVISINGKTEGILQP